MNKEGETLGIRQYIRDWIGASGKQNGARFNDTRPTPHDNVELDNATLKDYYRNKGLYRKLVAKPAEDMTRNGWRIVIPDNPDKQAAYQKAMNDLHLTTQLSQEFTYGRLFGDGYAMIGLDEIKKSSTDKAVEPTNIKNVAFVHAFSPENVDTYQINDNPADIHYGQEANVTVTPTRSGDNTTPVADRVTVDKSRYFHYAFGRLEGDDYGNSIINTCYEPLKVLDAAQYSVGKMFYELTFKVYKSQEVASLSLEDRAKLIDAMSTAWTTESVAVIADGEELTKVGTPLAGVSDIIEFAWQSLAAASNIPKSVLTGQEAGTLTGAQYDVINYYDQIRAQQTNELKPQIMQIVRYLMYSTDIADGYEDPESLNWDIEFNPLWDSDEKTQSEVLVNNVTAASNAMAAGILDPEEAKTMLAGQQGAIKSSLNDSIDDDDIKKLYQDALKKIHGE